MNNQEREAVARRYRGMRSRNIGLHFEKLIDEACRFYAEKGIADIEKTPEPLRPIKAIGDGRFIAVYTGEAQADYKGYLDGGRAVYFEAKATAGDRITQDRVTPNQTDRLNRAYGMGATVFVLCCIGGDRFAKVPWGVWTDMKYFVGRKYITIEDAAAHGWEIRLKAPGILAFLG